MWTWAQPSPTGSTPDSYVFSLSAVGYVFQRAVQREGAEQTTRTEYDDHGDHAIAL